LNFIFKSFGNDGNRGMLRKEGDKLARGGNAKIISQRVDLSEGGALYATGVAV
jgi:hypothetical protein